MFTICSLQENYRGNRSHCKTCVYVGSCRSMFTFGRVVHEEALKQLVLDGSLLSRVIGQDVFMAHIVQT